MSREPKVDRVKFQTDLKKYFRDSPILNGKVVGTRFLPYGYIARKMPR